MGGEDTAALERPLPSTSETPVRERLRWEKELMGLYLSDHPMGEVAERVGQFVTAYSGDLKDESLDGQRLVIGGIVTGVRSVITKTKSSMAVVTLEDLQGTLEVVVFPRTWEQTAGTWRDGAILLVAGRVDHRGDEASLLADGVWDWDAVAERGDGAAEWFAREVGAMDRRSPRRDGGNGPGGSDRRRPNPNGGNGANGGPANGSANGHAPGGANGSGGARVPTARAAIGAGAGTPALVPSEPIPTYTEPPGARAASSGDAAESALDTEEPALPDEARDAAAAAAQAPSRPTEARPGAVLNVRFAREAGTDRVVSAMQAFKSLLRERPGGTRVVVHVPAPGGSALPMELRGVAYDAELVAEVRRRVGDGVVDLSLG
jgi:hypothetical protein